MRSEYSLHQFLVWLLIFHALLLLTVARTSSSPSSHRYSISFGIPGVSAADLYALFGISVTSFVCDGF